MTPPVRVLDTRPGINKGLAGAFQANVPRTLSIAGANGIPANAIAITGNLTVVGQTRGGYLSITKTSTANPASSVLNFPAGDTRANGVTVPLNGTGDLWIVYKAPAGSTAHVLLDVTGYFRVATDGTTFYEKAPVRVLDSRFGIGSVGRVPTERPADAQHRRGERHPCGRPGDHRQPDGRRPDASRAICRSRRTPRRTPTTSTINFPLGDTRANGVTVPLNGNGDLSIVYKASGGSTHVLLDVTGYFLDGTAGKTFVPGRRVADPRYALRNRPLEPVLGEHAADVGRGQPGRCRQRRQGDHRQRHGRRPDEGGLRLADADAAGQPDDVDDQLPARRHPGQQLHDQISVTGSLSGVYKAPNGSKTHLIVDVFGYYK